MIKEFWEGVKEGFVGAMRMAAPVLKIVAVGVAMILFMLVSFWFATLDLR